MEGEVWRDRRLECLEAEVIGSGENTAQKMLPEQRLNSAMLRDSHKNKLESDARRVAVS